MAIGPITIFDKSLLQALSVDEAVWFGWFFRANIAPIFFAETLADLEKEVAAGRTPEHVVGNLAYKTPFLGAMPNMNHMTLCIANLVGHEIQMQGLPLVGGGEPVEADGRKGYFFEQPEEMNALARWQRGDFLGVERGFAKKYRAVLAKLDLRMARTLLESLGFAHQSFRDLPAVKAWADQVVHGDGQRFRVLRAALAILGIPDQLHAPILSRWKAAGGPRLPAFAPYAAYALTVELFFNAAVASGHISAERPSNRIDIGYLFYLPFCMIFTSCDRLHARTAPLFMTRNQRFVPGMDLKAGLAAIDAHFSAFPAEARERGLFKLAPHPPPDGQWLVADLWDQFLPRWRERANRRPEPNPEFDKRLLAETKKMTAPENRRRPTRAVDWRSTDHVVIERQVPVKIGKWRIIPRKAEGEAS